jgi:hypothetical protein
MEISTINGQAVVTGTQIASHNPFRWYMHDTYLPWCIRVATQSFWNHWLGIWVREDGVVFIVEMQAGNKKTARRITRFEIWEQRRPDRVYEILPGIACTKEEIDAFIGGYDYWSLIFRYPLYLVSGWWIGKKGDDGCYVCSEYWARVLNLPNAHRLAPRDMARIFGASRT